MEARRVGRVGGEQRFHDVLEFEKRAGPAVHEEEWYCVFRAHACALVDEVHGQRGDGGGEVRPGGDLGLRARPGEGVEPGGVQLLDPGEGGAWDGLLVRGVVDVVGW